MRFRRVASDCTVFETC